MADFIADDEILEVAIARELDANRLYLAIAAKVKDLELREVLEELAAEELEHKAKLELEVMKSGRVVSPGDNADEFEGMSELPEGELDMSYKEMLLMAIKKEDASFRLYVDLAGRVTDSNSKETLLAIDEEEMRHNLRFEYEYDRALKCS